MHVLVLNSLYPPNVLGGAEISVSTLVEALRSRGSRVTVVSIAPDGAEHVKREDGFARYYLTPVNIENPYRRRRRNPTISRAYLAAVLSIDSYNPWLRARLARIFKEEAPDVIHSNNLFGLSVSAWTAARKCGIPIVHTIRDHYLLCAFSSRFRNGRECVTRCAGCMALGLPRKVASRQVDVVVGISDAILSSHVGAGYFDRASRRVIYNGVTGPRAPARDALREGRITLGYLGQIAAIKGLELLLEAMRLVDDQAVDLLVAGEGNAEYVRQLQTRYSLANVRWLGHVDPTDFFRKTDLLVVPSLWEEPAGRVVAEAFCNAVPVLASNRGGLPEMLGSQGAGWSFDPAGGAESLAAEVRRLVRDRACLPDASRNAVLRASAFGVDTMTDAYMHAYASAMRREKTGITHSV